MNSRNHQEALLIMTTVMPDHVQELTSLLGRMVDCPSIENNRWVPFERLKSIHFARWAILPGADDAHGCAIPAQLLFASNFDGPKNSHLAELVDVAGQSGLDEIYGHCDGYPNQPTRENRLAYLLDHQVDYNVFYRGTPGRTVERIHQERELYQAIQTFLDSLEHPENMSPAAIRTAVQRFVLDQNQSRFLWAKTPPPSRRRPLACLLSENLGKAGLLLAALLLVICLWWGFAALIPAGALLVLAILYLVALRWHERRDTEDQLENFCPELKLVELEDLVVQNQMTSVLNIKPGWFRLLTLKLVLGIVNLVARCSNTGFLGGIPSIHFARWAIVDDNRRLLFLSNFDGSWENYLGDFIDKAAGGLTAIWTNTVGFPKTRWLFREGGARNAQRFKAYARKSQFPTQVWYSAYKQLTVQNINNNSRVRAGLYGDHSEAELLDWLRRL